MNVGAVVSYVILYALEFVVDIFHALSMEYPYTVQLFVHAAQQFAVVIDMGVLHVLCVSVSVLVDQLYT